MGAERIEESQRRGENVRLLPLGSDTYMHGSMMHIHGRRA